MEKKKTAKINWLTEYQVTKLTEKATFLGMSIAKEITRTSGFKEMQQVIFPIMKDLALAISNLYSVTPDEEKINILSNYIFERYVNESDIYASQEAYENYPEYSCGRVVKTTMGIIRNWPDQSMEEEKRELFCFVKKVTVYAFGKAWNKYMKNPEMLLDDDTLKKLAYRKISPRVAERYRETIGDIADHPTDFDHIITYVYAIYNGTKTRKSLLEKRPTEEIRQKLLDLTTEFIPVFGSMEGKCKMDVFIHILLNNAKCERQLMEARLLFGWVVKFFCENKEKVDFESLRQIIKANFKQMTK